MATVRKTERSRNWMAVAYNPNDATKHHGLNGETTLTAVLRKQLISPSPLGQEIVYYCHGTELCPTTGTEHLQMFFIFKHDQSLQNLIRLFSIWLNFPNTLAFKIADNNNQACIDYCQKDGTDFEFHGREPRGKGARSDLIAVVDIISAGGSMNDIAFKCPIQFIKAGAGIQRWVAAISAPRDFKTEVYWLHGPTGSGKSKWAMATSDRNDLYLKAGSNKWWDGYTNQKNVIMDDFRPSKEIPFEFLLRLLDRHPVMVEVKGASIQFAPERIFITTPHPPQETWSHCEWIGQEQLGQLFRRIDKVICFSNLQESIGYALLPPFQKTMNVWTNTVQQSTVGTVNTSDTCGQQMNPPISPLSETTSQQSQQSLTREDSQSSETSQMSESWPTQSTQNSVITTTTEIGTTKQTTGIVRRTMRNVVKNVANRAQLKRVILSDSDSDTEVTPNLC